MQAVTLAWLGPHISFPTSCQGMLLLLSHTLSCEDLEETSSTQARHWPCTGWSQVGLDAHMEVNTISNNTRVTSVLRVLITLNLLGPTLRIWGVTGTVFKPVKTTLHGIWQKS